MSRMPRLSRFTRTVPAFHKLSRYISANFAHVKVFREGRLKTGKCTIQAGLVSSFNQKAISSTGMKVGLKSAYYF